MAAHILWEAMGGSHDPDEKKRGNPFYLSHEDFMQFIYVASNIDVQMTSECQSFLRMYFAALRRLVGSISLGHESMFATMETLIRIATSHAKLCLRDKALVDDALISVMLVEESMSLAYNVSILGFKSLPQDQENLQVLYGQPAVGGGSGEGEVPDQNEDVDSMSESQDVMSGVADDRDRSITRLYARVIDVFQKYGTDCGPPPSVDMM
ncbi:Minichromosome maintenance domain-containing protein 2 [Rhizophlyctis rosea]|nr:Minichromosome maintenance domain-containing protein 2 [Rhizophlyctis rosea]